MQDALSRRGIGLNLFASVLVFFLAACGLFLAQDTIVSFMMESPLLNGLIIAVFVVGSLYTGYWMLRLDREFRMLEAVRRRFLEDGDSSWLEPEALRELPASQVTERLALYAEQVSKRCPPNSESHAEKVAMSLGLHTGITRYLSSLLVFLGLLGTFIGLLMAIGGIEQIISKLPRGDAGQDVAFIGEVISRLGGPLHGMATAFSTSVFGLVTSLLLGFFHLQLAAGQTRYIARLEALDSAIFMPAFIERAGTTIPDVDTVAQAAAAGAGPQAGGGVSEVFARYLEASQRQMKENLDRLVTIVERTEQMQAGYREAMRSVARQVETTDAAVARLSANQDMIRESLHEMGDLSRDQLESQRLSLAESRGMNDALRRLATAHEETQAALRDYQADLLRVVQRELGAIHKMQGEE